ncbi:hypothetical protein NX059_007269 [Plenodomus lindquistii]|nr:hypothetical protein NX059_007269 [Plenodomus lindquistii]
MTTTLAAISRKRSRTTLDPDSDSDRSQLKSPSPAPSSLSDTLKRTRTQCDLDELAIADPATAWPFDTTALLSSKRLAAPPGSNLPAHDNWARYRQAESLFVLCVKGNMQLHFELLCAALPSLYALSPSLQPLLLVHDPSTHRLSRTAPFSLPLIQAATPSHNHFVRLGLLHPSGGGRFPLDALVVVDWRGRRRLVLPFGWGAGRYADTPAGRGIQGRLMGLLEECVKVLEAEREGSVDYVGVVTRLDDCAR